MLIRNVHIENAQELSTIRHEYGVFTAIGPQLEPLPGEEVLDGRGCLALPPFIESAERRIATKKETKRRKRQQSLI